MERMLKNLKILEVNCSGLRLVATIIEDAGTLPIGTEVHAGDVIIGKTITTTEIGEGTRRAFA